MTSCSFAAWLLASATPALELIRFSGWTVSWKSSKFVCFHRELAWIEHLICRKYYLHFYCLKGWIIKIKRPTSCLYCRSPKSLGVSSSHCWTSFKSDIIFGLANCAFHSYNKWRKCSNKDNSRLIIQTCIFSLSSVVSSSESIFTTMKGGDSLPWRDLSSILYFFNF